MSRRRQAYALRRSAPTPAARSALPASANGVVGLKPTRGRVSRHGVMELSRTFDHVGPSARRVEDVAIMLDAIAGADASDATTIEAPAPGAVAALKTPIEGLRIGIDRRFALEGIDPGQASSIEAALKVLTGLGAKVVDVRMPTSLASSMRGWRLSGPRSLAAHRETYPSRAAEYGPYLGTVLAAARKTTRADVERARRLCARVARDVVAMLGVRRRCRPALQAVHRPSRSHALPRSGRSRPTTRCGTSRCRVPPNSPCR